MKTLDPTLQPIAEAVHDAWLSTDQQGDPNYTYELLSAEELERLLAAARTAIAAPVLRLHRPCHLPGQGHRCTLGHELIADLEPVCLHCRDWPRSYELHPCPTARAVIGVTA